MSSVKGFGQLTTADKLTLKSWSLLFTATFRSWPWNRTLKVTFSLSLSHSLGSIHTCSHINTSYYHFRFAMQWKFFNKAIVIQQTTIGEQGSPRKGCLRWLGLHTEISGNNFLCEYVHLFLPNYVHCWSCTHKKKKSERGSIYKEEQLFKQLLFVCLFVCLCQISHYINFSWTKITALGLVQLDDFHTNKIVVRHKFYSTVFFRHMKTTSFIFPLTLWPWVTESYVYS